MAKVKKCNIEQLQVEKELEQTIKVADPVRAESLNKLQRMRTIKTKNQERERLRLTKKLGEDNPQVQVLQAKIETNQAFTRNLKLETARAKTEAPVVESNSWVVHGRVLNNQREPVPGMKTAVYDRSGCPIQTCGREYTDKTGYFKLSIKDVADDATGVVAQNEQPEGFLYVLDSKNVIVHEDKRPLPIKAGQVQYLEVILDDKGCVVDNPWPDTREAFGRGPPPTIRTRYLGSSNSKELHDLKNQQPACQIDEIKPDHRVNFKTQKEALALDYGYCAYCFGKDKSKR